MRTAANAIIIVDAKILLVQQRKKQAYGLWSFPGGHVEDGETIEEALRREIQEELGAELVDATAFDVSHFTSDISHELELHSFLAIIKGGITLPEDELLDYGWFTLEQVEEMTDQLRKPAVLPLTRKAFASLNT